MFKHVCSAQYIYIYNIYIIYIISIIYNIYIIYIIYNIIYIYTLQYSEAYWTLVLYPLSCIQYLAKGTAFESMLFVNSSLYTYAMLIKYLTCYKFVWHDGHDWISPGWVLRVRNWFINPSNCIPSYPCSNPIHIPGATTRFFLESACHRACTPCRVITVTTQTQGIPVFQDIKDALMRLRKRSMISSDIQWLVRSAESKFWDSHADLMFGSIQVSFDEINYGQKETHIHGWSTPKLPCFDYLQCDRMGEYNIINWEFWGSK